MQTAVGISEYGNVADPNSFLFSDGVNSIYLPNDEPLKDLIVNIPTLSISTTPLLTKGTFFVDAGRTYGANLGGGIYYVESVGRSWRADLLNVLFSHTKCILAAKFRSRSPSDIYLTSPTNRSDILICDPYQLNQHLMKPDTQWISTMQWPFIR